MAAGYDFVRRRLETKWIYATNKTNKNLRCLSFLTSARVQMSSSFSGILHSVAWWLATDVSGQRIPVTLKGQAVQKNVRPLKMGPIFSRNVGK